MTPEEAIRIIKEECYVSNLLDIDKTIFINTALDMAVEALKQTRWIPVSERLPENGYWLWSAKGGKVQNDFYWDGHWEYAEKYGYEVIAWMPLPEPYKAESEE